MKKEITIVKEFDAPVEKVWHAWTDEKQVAQWWAPKGFTNPVCTVDAKVGGVMDIVMQAGPDMGPYSNMKAPMKATFTEVTENKKLAATTAALDDKGDTLLDGSFDVTFEDVGGRTKLTIHTAAEGAAQGTDQMLAGMEQGWNQQIEKLVQFVSDK